MENKDILEIVNKIIKHLEISPSSFMQEYGIDASKIADTMIDKQIEIIIEIIERETKGYKFTTENVKKLLEEENNEQCMAYLIAATRDNEFIENYITFRELRQVFKADLAIFTGDKKFIEECIDLPGFDTECKIRLIKAMGTEYIESYLDNKKDEYILLYQKIDLVIATHDSEYIQKFIEECPALSDRRLLELIIATGDESYIDKYIRGNELSDAYKVIAIKELAKLLDNPQTIQKYMDELGDTEARNVLTILINVMDQKKYIRQKKATSNEENISKLMLPSQMTIGIEIESIGKYGEALQNVKINGWTTKEDGSLNDHEGKGYCGVEVVSPILTNNGEIEKNIELICSLLKASGQKTNESCGAHVHIGADYLTTSESLINFLYLIENSEDFLYIISNEEGDVPRRMAMYYAEPFTSKLNNAMENGSVNLESEQDLESFAQEVCKVQQADRYIGINFYNLGNKRNTIEFRMPNGTLNPNQWIENINLFGGLVKAAEEIMLIESKDESERSPEENRKLELFGTLPTLNDEDRLNAILNLTIEGDKVPYIMRYNTNRELIKLNRKASFDEQFVLKKGMIKPKSIGKLVFTGNDTSKDEEER